MEVFFWIFGVAVVVFGFLAAGREISLLHREVKRLRDKQHESEMKFINHKNDVLDALRVAGLKKKPGERECWVKGCTLV